MLTDDEILATFEAVGIPRARPFARDVGPYDVTEPTYDTKRLVAEIERRVVERIAAKFDLRAAEHEKAWNNCASDGHRNASAWRDKMYEARGAAATVRSA